METRAVDAGSQGAETARTARRPDRPTRLFGTLRGRPDPALQEEQHGPKT
jgi:hypothetical protein